MTEEVIVPDPHRPGLYNYQVKPYGIPVWALIGHWKAVRHNAQMVADDYGLPVETVSTAIQWYRKHRAIIDARLAANDAGEPIRGRVS